MSGVRLVVAATAAVMGVALAGCSAMPSMPDWMPDFGASKPPSAELQSLRIESDPPGADVRTAQGQSCMTPCAITVPSEPQSVSISKIGFVPQTIQVSTGEPPDHSFWENPPPSLVPNPVQVVLQAAPPPHKPLRNRKPRGSASRTRTAAKMTPPRGGPANAQSDPSTAQPAASPFPPPPSPRQ